MHIRYVCVSVCVGAQARNENHLGNLGKQDVSFASELLEDGELGTPPSLNTKIDFRSTYADTVSWEQQRD